MNRLLALLGLTLGATVWAAEVKQMAVTIDDLPIASLSDDIDEWESMTAGLLNALSEKGVPAIGFVNERKLYVDETLVEARVALLDRWLDAGFELGSHGYAHLDAHRVPVAAFVADIRRSDTITERLRQGRGIQAQRYFRHPFLHAGRDAEYRQTILNTLRDMDYRVAPVTIDNQEYIYARAFERAVIAGDADLAARIRSNYLDYMMAMVEYYESQAIAIVGRPIRQSLLLHANRLNALAMGELLHRLSAVGYTFISMTEALKDPAYQTADGYFGPAGITWLHRWALTRGMSGEVFGEEPGVPAFVQQAFRAPQ